jgi:hypothetical protein
MLSDFHPITRRWVGRLRTVGIQRGVQEGEDTEGYEFEFGHHRRKESSQYDEQDVQSPFFSSSSTAWGSSIPSTPGGGGACSAPSPGAIPIGAMSIGSGCNTPKSVVVALPDEDSLRDDVTVEKRTDCEVWKMGDVKVAGVDIAGDEDGEKGSHKMDVDV